jgi:hypothetical protein
MAHEDHIVIMPDGERFLAVDTTTASGGHHGGRLIREAGIREAGIREAGIREAGEESDEEESSSWFKWLLGFILLAVVILYLSTYRR